MHIVAAPDPQSSTGLFQIPQPALLAGDHGVQHVLDAVVLAHDRFHQQRLQGLSRLIDEIGKRQQLSAQVTPQTRQHSE